MKLLKALEVDCRVNEESLCDIKISDDKTLQVHVKTSVQPASSAGLFAKVINKPKVQSAAEKAKTTEADLKKELKRGSMKEKWGLTLAYRVDGPRISLSGRQQINIFSQ